MNEKLAEFFQKLGKNVDRIAVVIFVLLLVGAGFFFLNEQGYRTQETPPPPTRPWSQKMPRPADLPEGEQSDYEKVANGLGIEQEQPPTIDRDESMSRLVAINMFDIKSVRSETERAKEIQKDFDRAQRLFDEKNYAEALRVVETILRRNPNHSRTLDLRQRIEAAMAPAEATPAPEAGTEPGQPGQ